MEQAKRGKSQKAVVFFFVTVIISTWLIWLPAFLIQKQIIRIKLPWDFFVTAGTFVPSLFGLLFAYLCGGKTELLSLLKSLINVRIGIKGWVITFLILPAVSAVSCLIFYLWEESLPEKQFPLWSIPLAFVYILIMMGPLGEEMGWRGFALKRMLASQTPLEASFWLGMIWSFWHLPLFFINGTTQNALLSFGIVPAVAGYFLYTMMISLLITLLFVISKGSVFGSIMLHAAGNLSLGVVPIILSPQGAIVLLLVLGITESFVLFGNKQIMFKKFDRKDLL
ncbi:MAG: CPBP family intramembrane metalloprotease [Acholeplasmataceae bacterium]|nr:CPBP family intramembrane metalloprotease [Acholeplasmataceae bacterium]